MNDCFSDCWLCDKKASCKHENQCAVFDGRNCEMKNVCEPKRDKCPLLGGFQLELSFGEAG
jgi:hypothetical protein